MAARLSLDARVDLGGLAKAARAAGRLGVDTEFMSEGRYRAFRDLTHFEDVRL